MNISQNPISRMMLKTLEYLDKQPDDELTAQEIDSAIDLSNEIVRLSAHFYTLIDTESPSHLKMNPFWMNKLVSYHKTRSTFLSHARKILSASFTDQTAFEGI